MISHLVNDVSSSVFLAWSVPHLLSFQELPVGGDLDVQCQLEVHELLVLAHLACHDLLGLAHRLLQLVDVVPRVVYSALGLLLSLADLQLHVLFLSERERHRERGLRGSPYVDLTVWSLL